MAMTQTSHRNGIPLQDLLKGIAETDVLTVINGVSIDSRVVQAGDLFLACQGEHTSGARYIKEAIDAGAVAVAIEAGQVADTGSSCAVPVIAVEDLRHRAGIIADRFYQRPSQDMKVVGITGTNGKTSVAHCLSRALSDYEEAEVGSIGTLGYGVAGSMQQGRNTTPDPVTIHSLFSKLRDEGVRSTVIEVSSHALEQGRVAGVDFTIGVFTNLSRDHLDYHQDMESYANAKKQLFLSPDMKFAVINGDDEYGKRLQSDIKSRLPVVSYGLVEQISDEPCDILKVQGQIRENTLSHLLLEIRSPWGRGILRAKLNGRFNAYNLLASLAVLCLLDVPFELAMEKLARVQAVPGRLEYFGNSQTPKIFVDYAHTPDALQQALITLREQHPGSLRCVFGCGGERDQGKRALMGEVAERHADKVVLTNDNPRGEDAGGIIEDILKGMTHPEQVVVELDRAEAIRSTIFSSNNEDIILVAGKGHETYQEIAGQRFPFSDRQLVRNVLEERS